MLSFLTAFISFVVLTSFSSPHSLRVHRMLQTTGSSIFRHWKVSQFTHFFFMVNLMITCWFQDRSKYRYPGKHLSLRGRKVQKWCFRDLWEHLELLLYVLGMSLLVFVLALWVVLCLEGFSGFICCCWLSDFRHMDFIKQAEIWLWGLYLTSCSSTVILTYWWWKEA